MNINMVSLKRKRDVSGDISLPTVKRRKLIDNTSRFCIMNSSPKVVAKHLAYACAAYVFSKEITKPTHYNKRAMAKAKMLAHACAREVLKKKNTKSKIVSLANQAAENGKQRINHMKKTGFCVECEYDTCITKNVYELYNCSKCLKTYCEECAPYWYYMCQVKDFGTVHIGWGNYTKNVGLVRLSNPFCKSCLNQDWNVNNVVRKCSFDQARKKYKL